MLDNIKDTRLYAKRYGYKIKLSEPIKYDNPPKDYQELANCWFCDMQSIWSGEILEGFKVRRCEEHYANN